MPENIDVAVAGAGPAGLLAGIFSAMSGAKTVIFEAQNSPGRKILASGAGRCNLSNLATANDFADAFGKQGRFVLHALENFSQADTRNFLAEIGLPTVANGARVYPQSNKAVDVLACLKSACAKLGVKIVTNSEIAELILEDFAPTHAKADAQNAPDSNPRKRKKKKHALPEKSLKAIKLTSGKTYQTRAVIIATGGITYPQLGATGTGYDLAQSAGHKIIAPVAAGTGLVLDTHDFASLAGVSLSGVNIRIDAPRQPKAGLTGEMLFTHQGITGPVVLDTSSAVARLIETTNTPAQLRVELIAGQNSACWNDKLENWRNQAGKSKLINKLKSEIPAAVAKRMLDLAKIDPDCTCAQVPGKSSQILCNLLGDLRVKVLRTEGIEAGFVTAGGVSLKQVAPATLQSKLAEGVFFAGEVLDLDGKCGGFNIQWAFSSGKLAGQNAAKLAQNKNFPQN